MEYKYISCHRIQFLYQYHTIFKLYLNAIYTPIPVYPHYGKALINNEDTMKRCLRFSKYFLNLDPQCSRHLTG